MDIPTLTEGARGCGYRKGGGLYLVSGRLSEPCPFLPITLDICPTCGGGVKPTRGWTYVDGVALSKPRIHGDDFHRSACVFQPENADRLRRCGLLWIGGVFYATPEAFTAEAASMGVSRRISGVPRDFQVGRTWVLLAHREAVANADFRHDYVAPQEKIAGDTTCAVPIPGTGQTDSLLTCDEVPTWTGHRRRIGGIFSAFVPERVEYVVKGDESEEDLEALVKRGIQPVRVQRATTEGQVAMPV